MSVEEAIEELVDVRIENYLRENPIETDDINGLNEAIGEHLEKLDASDICNLDTYIKDTFQECKLNVSDAVEEYLNTTCTVNAITKEMVDSKEFKELLLRVLTDEIINVIKRNPHLIRNAIASKKSLFDRFMEWVFYKSE